MHKFQKFNLSFLASSALMLILVLSPCKLRNFIQSQLNLEQTEVTSKSKTRLASSCIHFEEISTVIHSDVKPEVKDSSVFSDLAFNVSLVDLNTKINNSAFSIDFNVHSIPLYILYQNFKVHLS